LEAYKTPQYYRWLRKDVDRVYRDLFMTSALSITVTAVLIIVFALLPYEYEQWFSPILPAVLILVVHVIRFQAKSRQPVKKPLVYTQRVKRLLGLSAIFIIIVDVIAWISYIGNSFSSNTTIPTLIFMVGIYLLLMLTLPFLMILWGKMAMPMEKAINRWYVSDGRKKLASHTNMIKIGITGSYGKTSAKNILDAILSVKYNVIISPNSYNTPLGITRVIRNMMKGDEDVFIAEMGARHVGDIAELCDLVKPNYGLITSIGPQHIETFFNIENVVKTKFELIDNLPTDGVGFLPSDNKISREIGKLKSQNIKWFGFKDNQGNSLWATDITAGSSGSTFMLKSDDGNEALCATTLLGEHNIQNILGCCCVAKELGLTLDEIAKGIENAQPVEHRLQLLKTNNGITVIDDAFNSNPNGAKAALKVSSTFEGRKIVVTPGLVELGDAEQQENIIFGQEMAKTIDIALLIAGNCKDIKQGMIKSGFDKNNIHCFKTLGDATQKMSELTRIGDVILFENDLPDHYEK